MIQKYFQTKKVRNFSIAMLWINGGGNSDCEGKKGINKILSVLLGRGCKGFNNFEFSEYINSYGAELNFETFEDGILISLKSINDHFYKLLPLLDLAINEPLLLKSQFQIVKKNTINSLKKDKENPFNIVYEKWRKLVYFKHPYAYNPSGYEKDIQMITHSDILYEYENFKNRSKYLISNNFINNFKLVELCKENNNEKKSNNIKFDLKNEDRYISTHRESNQIIIMIGNQTCSPRSGEYLPLKILESHLSYGMSSVLFKLFREKNGLTYDVGVFNPYRQQNSPFLIYLSVSNENALLAFKILLEIWKNLISVLIPEKEINLAKVKLNSSFLIANQSLEEILQRRIQLIGNGLDPEFDEICLNKIEDIESSNILKIANKYLSKPFLSIYGKEVICKKIKEIWIRDL